MVVEIVDHDAEGFLDRTELGVAEPVDPLRAARRCRGESPLLGRCVTRVMAAASGRSPRRDVPDDGYRMIDPTLWLAFVASSTLFAALPGPDVANIGALAHCSKADRGNDRNGARLWENVRTHCQDATTESKTQSRRIFDTRAACCLNQSCAQIAHKMVFAQPRSVAGLQRATSLGVSQNLSIFGLKSLLQIS